MNDWTVETPLRGKPNPRERHVILVSVCHLNCFSWNIVKPMPVSFTTELAVLPALHYKSPSQQKEARMA